mmetsp:Transcript_6201/g.11298  ORF Transcript_6201/g.11298 Transcript_6201/m.11298 type:complete len:154 (-) Transcript_6201:226-687(-)
MHKCRGFSMYVYPKNFLTRVGVFSHAALLFLLFLLPTLLVNHHEYTRTNTEMTDLNPTDENYHHSSDFHGSWETDFGEGMKSILDVVHPELTTPEKGEKLPTLLMPWRGSVGGGILSSSNNKTKAKSNGNANNNLSIRRSSVSSRLWGLNGRQ